jgi:asparagine synthase (glutamine-hydrolysing)
MSGLVAVFDRTGNGMDDDRIQTMLSAIDHRGPDGSDAWRGDGVALGHQTLANTPTAEAGQQPLATDDIVVTADARLDNRPELCRRLDVAGTAVPDSQLLRAAYLEWGEEYVSELVGAFAVVIWDRTDGRLLCARDHFGVKPLYYHASDDRFAVASEPKALLALPWVRPSLDETKVGDFLTELFEDKQNTFYDTLKRVQPAHVLTVSGATQTERRYWDLDPSRTLTLDSDEAYARRFRDHFERAVSDRLRTDTPVAATLSGGLDSSSITAVAHDQLAPGRPLRTYSGVFDDSPDSDEREYIETLVDREGIDAEYVFLDDLSVLSDIDRAIEYHDEPVHNTMHYMKWEIARRANDDSVGVVLEGAHGDNAVDYGLGRLPELARTGRWRSLAHELRSMGEILDRPARAMFMELVVPHLVPRPVTQLRDRLRNQSPPEVQANPAIDTEFAARIGCRARHEELEQRGSVRSRSARKWQYRSLMDGSMTSFLEANDITHAAFGLEPRYPFIDIRLIEFTLAIPPSQQLQDGWTRLILRRALDDVLPEKIQWRPWKTTMNQAFINALGAADSELAALVDDPELVEPYLDTAKLAELYEEFQTDPDMRSARVLWHTISLANWLETARESGTTDRSAGLTQPE